MVGIAPGEVHDLSLCGVEMDCFASAPRFHGRDCFVCLSCRVFKGVPDEQHCGVVGVPVPLRSPGEEVKYIAAVIKM